MSSSAAEVAQLWLSSHSLASPKPPLLRLRWRDHEANVHSRHGGQVFGVDRSGCLGQSDDGRAARPPPRLRAAQRRRTEARSAAQLMKCIAVFTDDSKTIYIDRITRDTAARLSHQRPCCFSLPRSSSSATLACTSVHPQKLPSRRGSQLVERMPYCGGWWLHGGGGCCCGCVCVWGGGVTIVEGMDSGSTADCHRHRCTLLPTAAAHSTLLLPRTLRSHSTQCRPRSHTAALTAHRPRHHTRPHHTTTPHDTTPPSIAP